MEERHMKPFIFCTKIFAITLLIFANISSAPAQNDPIYLLRSGRTIRVKMDTEINSKVSSVNDTFIVRIAEPVSNRGIVVLPTGLRIDGTVLLSSPADIGNQDGKLEVSFDSLRLSSEQSIRFEAKMKHPIVPKDQNLASFLTIAGTTAAGAIFGSISKVRNGTAIGALIGAGSGTGVVLLRKGRDLRIKSGDVFEIELSRDVMLPAQAEY